MSYLSLARYCSIFRIISFKLKLADNPDLEMSGLKDSLPERRHRGCLCKGSRRKLSDITPVPYNHDANVTERIGDSRSNH